MMENVIDRKIPVPFKRFTEGAGHKKGRIAAGKFPVKASTEVLALLNSLEANAQQKGLNTTNLIIKHICANNASRPPRYGRIRGILAKRSHIEIVAAEADEKEETKAMEKKKGKMKVQQKEITEKKSGKENEKEAKRAPERKSEKAESQSKQPDAQKSEAKVKK